MIVFKVLCTYHKIFIYFKSWYDAIGLMSSVHQGSGRPGFNPRSSHTKDLKRWYLMPPCLTLGIIRYVSRVKWSNPGKGVVHSPTTWCSSYWKGSLWVNLDLGHQLYFTYDDMLVHTLKKYLKIFQLFFRYLINVKHEYTFKSIF